MSQADLLRVVEAAYELERSDVAWLQGITDAVGPLLDAGYGAYGTALDTSDSRMNVGPVVSYRGQDVFVEAIRSTARWMTSEDCERVYRNTPAIATATERVGVAGWNAAAAVNGPSGVGDCAAVLATNAAGVGCMIVVPLQRVHRFPERVKRVWSRVTAHVVAMQRLRDGFGDVRARGDGEAVLSPSGKIEHAVGPAEAKSARERLRAAALAREQARGRLRKKDPEAAVEMWRALVAGRWSIVDRFDRDGRRYLIAHENEPGAAEPRMLTARERQVVTQAALGHSNKLIAYELGLSLGAVSAYLALAMKKLGLGSRLDLMRLVRAARPS